MFDKVDSIIPTYDLDAVSTENKSLNHLGTVSPEDAQGITKWIASMDLLLIKVFIEWRMDNQRFTFVVMGE